MFGQFGLGQPSGVAFRLCRKWYQIRIRYSQLLQYQVVVERCATVMFQYSETSGGVLMSSHILAML